MTTKGWFGLATLIIFVLVMSIGGPRLSRQLTMRYNKSVAEKGKVTKAVIVGKNTHKGNSVTYRYTFNGVTYKNNEQNDIYYDELTKGDSVIILLDSTRPHKSYILSY